MTPKLARIFALFPPSCKTEARIGRLPSPGATRTMVEGLISLFCWHFDVLSCRVFSGHVCGADVSGKITWSTDDPIWGVGGTVSAPGTYDGRS